MIERIHNKIGKVKYYLSLIDSLKENCLQRFNEDPVYRGALLHYLYLMSDTCISLAEIVIKQKNLRVPQSYQEAFDILGEGNILETSFAFEFAKIAGFRNFLAHDYENLDVKSICESALKRLGDVEKYITQLENALRLK